MARKIDTTKLDAIKEALMKIVLKEGYSNASIAKIANEANVSVGYLYQYYSGKESLLMSIYIDQFRKLNVSIFDQIEKSSTFHEVIHGFYHHIVQLLETNETEILFLWKTITDYSITISEESKSDLKNVIDLLKNKYKKDIRPELDGEYLYIQVLGSILFFINLRKRGIFSKNRITLKDIDLLTQTTIKALQ